MSRTQVLFEWDEANVRHLARHIVTPEKAEQCYLSDPLVSEEQWEAGDMRYLALGETFAGRRLAFVFTIRGDCVRAEDLRGGMRSMSERITIPTFASETEEALWWEAHPEALTERFQAAKAAGRVQRLSQTNLPGAEETVTIRIAAEELTRARELAAKRGLRYETYLKMLLHEALDAEEKNLAS